jgi:hypothetical protein
MSKCKFLSLEMTIAPSTIEHINTTPPRRAFIPVSIFPDLAAITVNTSGAPFPNARTVTPALIILKINK